MKQPKISINLWGGSDPELRARLGEVRVLVADRDQRTAMLVQRILFAFGLRNIELTTDGEKALELLRLFSFDFLITEWNMHPMDGLSLVRAIRHARDDKRIRRDIPILMLTAEAELMNVTAARDAGITEFIAKPFSAATISSRIIQIIDNPRAFVESPHYIGPCRRRRGAPPPGMVERRGRADAAPSSSTITPPDFALREQLGIASAAEVFTPAAIAAAQDDLMQSQGDYVDWAREDIAALKSAFRTLSGDPSSIDAQQGMLAAAYAIQSQAGTFGYSLGTEMAKMLHEYVTKHRPPSENHLLVIGKYIDAIAVTFNRNVEQFGQSIARDLIASLRQLTQKLEN